MKGLADRSVLIVEDDPLIALDVFAALSDAGATVIPASNPAQAVHELAHTPVSAALLDINLGASDCSAVCDELSKRSIPFAFYTGYSSAPVISRWAGAPILQKPAGPRDIVAAVAKLLPQEDLAG